MGPFSAAMLVNAGFSILGGIGDMKAAKQQRRIEELTAEANAGVQKNQVASQYLSLFEKQKQQLGVQKASLANMGIDKANSFFSNALGEHERNYLASQNNFKKDLTSINFNKDMAKLQAGVDYSARKNEAIKGMVMDTGKSAFNWADKKGKLDWFYNDMWPTLGGK